MVSPWPDLLTPLALAAGGIAACGVALIVLLPRFKWIIAALLLAILTPLALAGFWPNGHWGISDWDYYFSYHEVLRRMTLEYGTVPTWNPYICGGTSAIGDPEFPFFTPTFLLELLFGVPIGIRLAAMLATTVGAIGMLALARRLQLSVLAGLVAALIFSFGSVTILELVEGHPNVFAVMYIPWILWAWHGAYFVICDPLSVIRTRWWSFFPLIRGIEGVNKFRQFLKTLPPSGEARPVGRLTPLTVRPVEAKRRSGIRGETTSTSEQLLTSPWVILTGLLLALMFFQGGIYLLMYLAGAFVFLIAVAKRRWEALLVTAFAGVWALGLAAIKLLPALFWLAQFQDQVYASSANTITSLHHIFLGRYLHGSEDIIPNQGGGWHEYGAYIGPFAVVLVVLGLTKIKQSRVVRLLALASVIALAISSAGPLLKPLFDQAGWLPRSNVSRVILMAILPISLLAGVGLQEGQRWIRQLLTGRTGTFVTAAFGLIILILITLDLGSLTQRLSGQTFVLPPTTSVSTAMYPIEYTIIDNTIRHEKIDYTRAYSETLAGFGTQTYCTVLGPSPAVMTKQHFDEDRSYLRTDTDDSLATLVSWQPNRIVVNITADTPTYVRVNANYAKGWYVEFHDLAAGTPALERTPRIERLWRSGTGVNGQPARDIANRLATKVSAGSHTLVFTYQPPGYPVGQSISVIFFLVALILLARHYKMR